MPNNKITIGDTVGIYEFAPVISNEKPLLEGIVYRTTDFKIIVSYDKKNENDDNMSEIQNKKLILVLTSNEITHQRHSTCLKTLFEMMDYSTSSI